MKLAVTDACIFIDLIELDLISLFFGLEYEIHTTINVLNELEARQKQILQAYRVGNKLNIHTLSGEEQSGLNAHIVSNKLSIQDKSVLFLAEKLSAIVLSSDKTVRKHAKQRDLNYHGIFWIFDQLIEAHLLSNAKAIATLQKLPEINQYYMLSKLLSDEIAKRIELWSDDNII